jgi:choline dehydrogenase-like flavoprotein
MFYDANQLEASFEPASYDLCIVGAGAAGISIANALDKSGKRVCLLEGGGEQFSQESQSIYKGQTGDLAYRVKNSRLRFFGGTTNHWSGWCSPYDASDFEPSWFEMSGWPIPESELFPYYGQTSEILELIDSNFSDEFWQEKLGKFVAFKNEEIVNRLTLFSKPVRFGTKYKATLQASSNVDVFVNANVFDLALSDDAQTVKSVFAKNASGKAFIFNTKNCVLACGGIENARLLLNFRKQTPKGLGNQNDQVGRYFMEHIHWRHKHSPLQVMINSLEEFSKNYRLPRRSSERPPLISWQINSDIRKEKRLANSHVHELFDFEEAGDMEANLFNMHEKLKGKPGEPTRNYIFFAEQLPNPESRVTLLEDRCSLGLNRTNLKWSLLEDDLRSVTESLMIFAKAIGKNALGNARVSDWALEGKFLDEEYIEGVEGGNHHMGTTKMSASPKDGVVDEYCRVHGMNNLYIAGSSVFPTGGAVGPTFTIVALALRLSDYLKQKMA